MPWAPVGIGRKAAPPLDSKNELYCAFWAHTLAAIERFATDRNTDDAQHHLQNLPDHIALQHYPNCALFGTMGDQTSIVQRAFLYATPFVDVVRSRVIYECALTTLSAPRAGTRESWYPVAFEDLHDDADAHPEIDDAVQYRIYKSLVLRVAFLLRLIKIIYTLRTEKSTDEERRVLVQREQRLYHWLDAHMLMMCMISQLGHVPHDASPEMALLLEHYSPASHMAFSEGELADVSSELGQAAFFTQDNDARRSDPLVYTFSKVLPHRCEGREAAGKVATVSAYNTGYFCFIKSVLVAMFLGIYRRCNYRAGWALRFSVYRLFFARMHPSLQPYRTTRRASGGGPAPLGGTSESLDVDFNLNELCDAVLAPLSPTRRERAVNANMRLQHTNYAVFVAGMFNNVDAAQRKVTTEKKKSDTELRNEAARPWNANYKPPTKERVRLFDTPALDAEEREQAQREHAMRGVVEPGASCSNFDWGIYVANALSRMTLERNCGADYYQQRLAANALPDSGITLRDGTSVPPPEPVEPDTALTYKDAFKGMLPCDRVLPDEESLKADAIIYNWITTIMIKNKPSAAGKKRKAAATDDDDAREDEPVTDDDDDDGATKKKAGKKPALEREYSFQNAICLAIRQYLNFALERWLEPLRHELFGRVRWASWEESVMVFGDGLRLRLDQLYVEPCPLGAFLTSHSSYQWMTNATRARPINNHYTSERESFLSSLKKHMKAKVNSRGFGDAPVDRVVPRETDVLIQHLLQSWNYPRVAPPIKLDQVPRAGSPTPSSPSDRPPVFEQFREHIIYSPQLVYLIEPVEAAPLPPDVLAGGSGAIRAYIRTEYVERGRFPLSIFHAARDVLAEFAQCRVAYHMAPGDPIVREFVEWLSARPYQFYLLWRYCKIVERHQEIHTFTLPRHIVKYQLDTLAAQYCLPADTPPPPHLMRSLVCLGCKRCASVFPTPTQRHSAMAVGNDEVRFVSRTDDDEVYERVRARGYMPLPYTALMPAASWTEVLQYRSQPAAEVYDRYCDEPNPHTEWRLPQPACAAHMPFAPEASDLDDYARDLFADTFSDESRARHGTPLDRRTLIYDDEHPDVRDQPLQPIARGKGRLGEMTFDGAMWQEVNRRMRIFDGGGADDDRSFLLLGHSIEGADIEHYSEIKWCDTTQRIKAESKKSKQSNSQKASIEAIADDSKRKTKLANHEAKRRRDAESMARFAMCSRRRMLEIDFCGRALRGSHLYVAGRASTGEDDCILACCDCLTRIWSTQANAIGDRIVCTQCYLASKSSGGTVAQRAIRGESTKSVSATTLPVLNPEGLRRTRSTPEQTRLSPSFSTLCSPVIPLGTCCTMDRCKMCKTDDEKMYALEVLVDTDVDNETYRYMALCFKHARAHARAFRVVTKLPLSALKLFMMQNRRDFAEVVTRGSYLDDVMRRTAHASSVGTQARAEEDMKRQKKVDSTKQRKQRMLAIAESTRQRGAASSAVMK